MLKDFWRLFELEWSVHSQQRERCISFLLEGEGGENIRQQERKHKMKKLREAKKAKTMKRPVSVRVAGGLPDLSRLQVA